MKINQQQTQVRFDAIYYALISSNNVAIQGVVWNTTCILKHVP